VANSVSTMLMFVGKAEEAMRFYVSLFKNSEILQLDRFGPGELGEEGRIKRARFTLCGHEMTCFDSSIEHAFTFTPSMSLFVECEDAAELDRAYESLAVDGQILMPPDNYGFSRRFVWLNDRFGVSWQLNAV
jgi:predicted 3-demethylubiquinone-9 3-methyltransferase (glyoxalase superfamily)